MSASARLCQSLAEQRHGCNVHRRGGELPDELCAGLPWRRFLVGQRRAYDLSACAQNTLYRGLRGNVDRLGFHGACRNHLGWRHRLAGRNPGNSVKPADDRGLGERCLAHLLHQCRVLDRLLDGFHIRHINPGVGEPFNDGVAVLGNGGRCAHASSRTSGTSNRPTQQCAGHHLCRCRCALEPQVRNDVQRRGFEAVPRLFHRLGLGEIRHRFGLRNVGKRFQVGVQALNRLPKRCGQVRAVLLTLLWRHVLVADGILGILHALAAVDPVGHFGQLGLDADAARSSGLLDHTEAAHQGFVVAALCLFLDLIVDPLGRCLDLLLRTRHGLRARLLNGKVLVRRTRPRRACGEGICHLLGHNGLHALMVVQERQFGGRCSLARDARGNLVAFGLGELVIARHDALFERRRLRDLLRRGNGFCGLGGIEDSICGPLEKRGLRVLVKRRLGGVQLVRGNLGGDEIEEVLRADLFLALERHGAELRRGGDLLPLWRRLLGGRGGRD